METIRGKRTHEITDDEFGTLRRPYARVLLDLGTGDGRFARHLALANPTTLVIGVDACRENLIPLSRRAPANTLYVIANALDLPVELRRVASAITINFPWGSLLAALLEGHPALLSALSGAALELRLNAGALEECGWSLEAGGDRIAGVLTTSGFRVCRRLPLDGSALRSCPSTWAKRLAFGRDPRGIVIAASRPHSSRSGATDLAGHRPCARPPPGQWHRGANRRETEQSK